MSKVYELPDGTTVEPHQAFTIEADNPADNVHFPKGWLRLAKPADLKRHGITAVTVEDPVRPVTSDAIKGECTRRIIDVIKDDITWSNMIAHAVKWSRMEAKGTLESAADLNKAEAILDWVDAMQGVCRELAAAADATFEDNAHWPAPPKGAKAFAERF